MCPAPASFLCSERETQMIVLDNQDWIDENFGGVELGDKRRTKRMLKVAANLLDAPDQSLPQQNQHWSSVKAAYRLFDSGDVTFSAVATPHWKQTRESSRGRCLLISDTTELDFTGRPGTSGLAQIGNGKGQGMLLHSCLAYNCEQAQIIGTAAARIHLRRKVSKQETQRQRLKQIRESSLWGQVVDDVGQQPQATQWIHVFDRGGDNFEALCHIVKTGADFVVRAAQLNRIVIDKDGEQRKLREAITNDKTKILGSYELALRSRQGVKARSAKIQVRSTTVTFISPKMKSPWVKKCGVTEIKTNVVIVEETDAPKGIEPIKWVLLTTLRASSFKAAYQVIEDYECRWMIEEYHKVLKTGCRIEAHQLRTQGRLEALIGVITVIGTRLLGLKYVGRNQPDTRAATHVPASWLRVLKATNPKLAVSRMTVYTFFRELAKLGGFLARASDGEPGWETTWRGLKKLQLLLAGMRLAKEI